jgi:hypothetical protein
LKSLDEKYTTLLQTTTNSSSPSPDNISSSTIQDIINEKFTQTFQPTIDAFARLTTTINHLQSTNTTITSTSSPPTRSSGFLQRESKDFHVSKLLKLLDNESLTGDSLQELEIFYDNILSHFNTVTLSNDLYPTYRNLTKNFDFERHLCQLTRTIGPSPPELAQAKANYKSFGTGL